MVASTVELLDSLLVVEKADWMADDLVADLVASMVFQKG